MKTASWPQKNGLDEIKDQALKSMKKIQNKTQKVANNKRGEEMNGPPRGGPQSLLPQDFILN